MTLQDEMTPRIDAGSEPLDPATTPTVSVPRAAKFLGVGRGSAYAAIKSGELPAIRIGRRLVVPTARLLEMLGQAEPRRSA